MDVRAEKSRTSAPKSAFFCGPGDGEKLFDPRASGRKGQECAREIRTEESMVMLFFSALKKGKKGRMKTGPLIKSNLEFRAL